MGRVMQRKWFWIRPAVYPGGKEEKRSFLHRLEKRKQELEAKDRVNPNRCQDYSYGEFDNIGG